MNSRADWYARHRRARTLRQHTGTLRELMRDRHCPTCGAGLGGRVRHVFTRDNDTYFSARDRDARHVIIEMDRPAQIVVCGLCLRLYRGELCAQYAERNRQRMRRAA